MASPLVPTASAGRTREPAPAKLNLCLRVLGRRPDGRHELWSIAEPLTLADEVEIQLEATASGGPEVTCRCPGHPSLDGPDNLAARAALRLLGTAPLRCTLTIHKHIPEGAGLGGGSADAAAVLRGLGRLLTPPPPHALLEESAASLGADVPFCLRSEAALMQGFGERLTPVTLPDHWLCLVFPELSLSTADVYARHRTANATKPQPAPKLDPITTLTELSALVRNDLEKAAVSLAPELAAVRQALEDTAPIAVGMTGSGSCFFGLYGDEPSAGTAAASLGARGWRTWVAAPLGRSTHPEPSGDETTP